MHSDKSQIGLTPDEVAIFLESGANVSLSNSKDDFIGKIYPMRDCEIKGIAFGLSIEGIGTIECTLLDDRGN